MDIEQYAYPHLKPLEQDWQWVHKYAYDVVNNNIPSCKKVRQMAERHFRDLERDDIYFDEDAARSIVLWFKFVPLTDGKDAGSPTILDPAQIFIACSLNGWLWSETTYDNDGNVVTVKGHRRFNQCFILISRKWGKALALDTPIPTPQGWATMGDLQIGDVVFDEKGEQCNVTDVTDIQHNRHCFKLTFSNGETVIADEDHQWVTRTLSDNHAKSVKTTGEIFKSMKYGKRGDNNHHMDMPDALYCDEAYLPVDPYLLGYWLGDGSSDSTRISCGDEDVDHLVKAIKNIGYECTVKNSKTCKLVTPIIMQDNGKRVCGRNEKHLKKLLKKLDVISNKHIPDMYKRASYSQRLALIQGLMDSDGTIEKDGKRIRFNQNKGKLFDDFCEMIASIGIKYTVRTKRNKTYNSVSMECSFNTAKDDHMMFRLERKLNLMKNSLVNKHNSRSKTVTIVKCEPVDSVPVKCISVDSPNRLYRFGRTMLPTHNTTFIAGIMLYFMYKHGYRPRAFSLATKRDQAKEVWNTACSMINLSPRLRSIFKARANDILLPSKEGSFRALASDSNSLDGLNPMAATLDECHAIKDRNLYGVIISAFGAQPEFLFSVITTAGFILDGLCTDLYKNGARVLDSDDPTEQDNYFYAIYEIDKGDDWTEPKNWYKSNPALIYGRPSMGYLKTRLAEAQLTVAEKANFITKHCNIFVSGSDKWLDMDEVYATRDVDMKIEDYIHLPSYIAIDRARVNDICSVTILFTTPDGGVALFYRNLLPKVTVDTVSDFLRTIYHKAIEEGDLEVVRTNTVRNDQVESLIEELWNDLPNCQGVYYDPWHMREVCESLEEKGVITIAVSQGTGNMSEPAKKLEGLIKEGLLKQNSTLFEYACSCAMMSMTRKNNMDIYRENDKVDKIDPVIAAIIGLSGATLFTVERNIYEQRGLQSI